MDMVKKITHDYRFGEFIRFCIVGTLAATIHYGIYFLLQLFFTSTLWLSIDYTIGYVVSLVCNYFMTTYFTFKSNVSVKHTAGFGFSHVVNYTLHIALFNLFIGIGIDQRIAPILVLLVAVPTNFTILHFVFRKKKERD